MKKTWKYHPTDYEAVHKRYFGSPLPCDVTLQVSDMSLVSLLHGIVRPDARCAEPLHQDLRYPGTNVFCRFALDSVSSINFAPEQHLTAFFRLDALDLDAKPETSITSGINHPIIVQLTSIWLEKSFLWVTWRLWIDLTWRFLALASSPCQKCQSEFHLKSKSWFIRQTSIQFLTFNWNGFIRLALKPFEQKLFQKISSANSNELEVLNFTLETI